MELSQIIILVLGSSNVALIIKLVSDWRKNRAETKKTETEVETLNLTNEQLKLDQLGQLNKTIADLVRSSAENVKKISEHSEKVLELEGTIGLLEKELDIKKAVIRDHRDERAEWIGLLEKYQKKAVELELKIDNVEARHCKQMEEIEERYTTQLTKLLNELAIMKQILINNGINVGAIKDAPAAAPEVKLTGTVTVEQQEIKVVKE